DGGHLPTAVASQRWTANRRVLIVKPVGTPFGGVDLLSQVLVEETKHERSQVALLWLQMKAVRGVGHDDELVLDPRRLQSVGKLAAAIDVDRRVGGAMDHEEGRVVLV